MPLLHASRFLSSTDNWNSQRSATVTRSSSAGPDGTAGVLEIVTPGSLGDEGANYGETSGTHVTVANSTGYVVRARCTGTGTVHINVNEYTSGYSYVTTVVGSPVALDGTWKRVELSWTTQATTGLLDLFLLTDGVQSVTFYADDIRVLNGNRGRSLVNVGCIDSGVVNSGVAL